MQDTTGWLSLRILCFSSAEMQGHSSQTIKHLHSHSGSLRKLHLIIPCRAQDSRVQAGVKALPRGPAYTDPGHLSVILHTSASQVQPHCSSPGNSARTALASCRSCLLPAAELRSSLLCCGCRYQSPLRSRPSPSRVLCCAARHQRPSSTSPWQPRPSGWPCMGCCPWLERPGQCCLWSCCMESPLVWAGVPPQRPVCGWLRLIWQQPCRYA